MTDMITRFFSWGRSPETHQERKFVNKIKQKLGKNDLTTNLCKRKDDETPNKTTKVYSKYIFLPWGKKRTKN